MSSFLLVVFRFPNAVFSPGSCFVFAFSCSSFLPLCCVVFSSVAFRFFLVGLKYLTCSVALRGSRAFGATTLAAMLVAGLVYKNKKSESVTNQMVGEALVY